MGKRSVGARILRIRRYRSLLFTRNSFHDNCSNRVVPRDASYVETKLVCLFTYGCTRSPPACMYAVFKFARAHARTGNITFAAEMEQRTRKKEKTSLGKNIHIYTWRDSTRLDSLFQTCTSEHTLEPFKIQRSEIPSRHSNLVDENIQPG